MSTRADIAEGGAAAQPHDAARPAGAPLLEVDHLKVWFPVAGKGPDGGKRHVHAVDDVTFTLAAGETLGLVGESGCGKTSLARTLVRLNTPTGGSFSFRGRQTSSLSGRDLTPFRRDVQMVFQDPQASLNPRKRVNQIIGAALKLRRSDASRPQIGVKELLSQVGLDPEHAQRFPHEFSGGQRQRIGIARALAVDPKLIILDEPVSALDVSVQAQVVNLLDDLQDDFGLSYIFVAHDLSVVRHISDRIAVMYLGKIVELSSGSSIYSSPKHPYTASLLESIPIPDPDRAGRERRHSAVGELPSPIDPPPGCRFAGRCRFATQLCRDVEPPLTQYPDGHLAACHHPLNVTPIELTGVRRSPSSPLSSGSELPTAPAAEPTADPVAEQERGEESTV